MLAKCCSSYQETLDTQSENDSTEEAKVIYVCKSCTFRTTQKLRMKVHIQERHPDKPEDHYKKVPRKRILRYNKGIHGPHQSKCSKSTPSQ